MLNPIVYAIPVFFLLMGLELLVARMRGRSVYRVADAVTSIGLGAVSQVTGIFSKLIFLGIYVLAYEHVRVTTLPLDAVWVWLVGLLIYDFLYYWHHRMGHEMAVLWAAHVVHHQSEDYNLSTALRQTSTGFLLGWIFYLPMAVAGFPPLVFVVVGLIDLLYQYWIHTEVIGRLGWFDRVFASPSNHRVHHAVNDRYLDKNYGGILILWDRLFGTFKEEDDAEPVVYGTRAPLRSYSPLWANVEVYAALAHDAWRARRWRDKFQVWFRGPGWRPADVAERYPKPAFDLARVRKFDPPVSGAVKWYGFAHFVFLTAAGVHCLAIADRPDTDLLGLGLYATWLCFSLWTVGGLLEGRRSVFVGEALRLIVGAAAVLALRGGYALPLPSAAQAALVAWFGLSLLACLALALQHAHTQPAAA